ncbi:MAG: class B sortase [Defluviitaleaceae bacterium]|nr:class B sortase [Defluviitaleaceae bacterium]
MEKHPQSSKKVQKHKMLTEQKKRRQGIVVCFALITTICAVLLAFKVIPHVSDLIAFQREQASLPNISPFDSEWLEINPDYVGWVMIGGTNIDFPVVRGSDNVKYLDTSFRGEDNMMGSIFMDYRVTGDSPHIIIYGHSLGDYERNTAMFGGLNHFLDEQHLAEHPYIWFMENGYLSEFKIFSARATDIYDPAYHLDFNAPGSFEAFLERTGLPVAATQATELPRQIITLSTCIGLNTDYRLIVQGALKRTIPITTEYRENVGWTFIRPE